MGNQNNHLYVFGSFQINPAERLLLRNGEPVRIPPKAFQLLLFLVQRSNQVVDKETIMREVWRSTFVEDANLTVHISTIRRTLAADPEKSASIETFPRRGYRFVGEVRKIPVGDNTFTEATADSEIEIINELQNRQENGIPQPLKKDFDEKSVEDKEAARPISQSDSVLALSGLDLSQTSDAGRRNKTGLFLVSLAVILIAVLVSAFTLYKFYKSRPSPHTMRTTRILDTGKTVTAAVSPDGKYVVHAVADAGKQSIWIKHLATNSNVQIVEPKEFDYPAMTFTNDGNYVYYVQHNGELYQVPVLGGEPKKILTRVNSAISFSPDARQFAFVRRLPADETAVMIANADGSAERQLATRKKPEFFVSPSWSPDGKVITCSTGNRSGDPLANVVEIPVEGGSERVISPQKWRAIEQVAWLSDGSGLIASAAAEAGNGLLQIWFFPTSGGEARQITNDLNNYRDVSLSADSSALVTIRFEQRSNIWLLPQGRTEEARLVSNNVQALYRFIASTPDGKIIYPSQEESKAGRNIWIMNADGSNARQLTADAGDNILPCATADGRYIVFTSNRADMKTYHLWRMNMDGSNPVQLTKGSDGERGPACSPDGKTVFYASGGPDVGIEKSRLWKVSIDGGEPLQLTDYPANWKDVSPDGNFVAVRFKSDADSTVKLGIIPATGGQPVKVFDLKENTQLRWKPDGRSISYIKNEKDVSNIWEQPISGDPPKQLTKFNAETIYFFDWSKEGDLIFTKGYEARDPVLIVNFK